MLEPLKEISFYGLRNITDVTDKMSAHFKALSYLRLLLPLPLHYCQ